jgi:hypothetical protein
MGARKSALLDMSDMVHLPLARFSRLSRTAVSAGRVHDFGVRTGAARSRTVGWKRTRSASNRRSWIDIAFGYGTPNDDRIACCSEAELIEFANRRGRLTILRSTTS